MSIAAAQPEPRLPLSRARILQAALELADADGVEAVTMRRLGQKLGFEAMSLYNHVANKDDVLDGILDLVLERVGPPEGDDWEAAIRASAISLHEAFQAHPWAAPLLISPGRVRAVRLRYMESLLGRLRAAGLSPDQTYHAYHVLDAYTIGFSLWHLSHTYSPAEVDSMIESFTRMIPESEYPNLNEHARQHMTDGPHREVSAFELGLDLILDGLKRRIEL